jgi:RHS repeat-associated protein
MKRITRLAWAALALTLFQPLAAVQAQVVEYYHADGLGSVRVVTRASGLESERLDYLPFGEEWNAPVNAQPRRFTGKERDVETDLDYFGARYYGSKIGRFATVDPLLDQKAALVDPRHWNRYAYVLNNPLTRIDPDGRADYLYVVSNVAKSDGVSLTAGHSNLVRFNSDTNTTTTYALWPDAHPDIAGAGLANGSGSDVRTNFPNDNPAYYSLKFGVELTPAQAAALDTAVARPSEWGYTNTCASWAASTFTDVTGVKVPASELAGITDTPRRLGDSIKAKVAGNAGAGVFPPGPGGAPGLVPAPARSSSAGGAQSGPTRRVDER